MTWTDIELFYYDNLDWIKRQSKIKSKDFCEGMYLMLRSYIRKLKLDCEDFPRINNDVFSYRGNNYNVLFDDYGQQLCLDYHGYVIGGGAFNSFPELDFSECLDDLLDVEYLCTNQDQR